MVSDEINFILASVSSITEIPPEDILSKSKQSDIVDVRYIVVKILKKAEKKVAEALAKIKAKHN